MKRSRRSRSLLPLCALAGYFLLLLLLMAVEGRAEGATIRTFPDALWYSVTTLTTVGYGDLYPVTTAGRLIGLLFQLMSLGVLAALVGLLLQLTRGRLTALLLFFRQDREWYIFTHVSPEACVLARRLAEEDAGAVLLGICEEGGSLPADFPGLRTVLTPEALLALKKDPSSATVICMGPDDAENRRTAHRLRRSSCRLLCRSAWEPEELPARQLFYDPATVCARLYWHRFPVTGPREKIVLVGSGPTAEALLDIALSHNLVTLRGTQELVYTWIGDSRNYLRSRPFLAQACVLAGQEDAAQAVPALFHNADGLPSFRDTLRIKDGPWNADWQVFREADRIIFAGEDERETESLLAQLFRCCPVTGEVHARLSAPFDGVEIFGGTEDLYTPELLLRRRLSRTAMALHADYRRKALAAAQADPDGETAQAAPEIPGWDALGCFLRRSNLASADHLPVKAGLLAAMPPEEELTPAQCREAAAAFRALPSPDREACRALEHARWCRFHLLNNWQYAPVRDNARRLHPLLVPYGDLSAADRAKDDGAWLLFETLSEEIHADE